MTKATKESQRPAQQVYYEAAANSDDQHCADLASLRSCLTSTNTDFTFDDQAVCQYLAASRDFGVAPQLAGSVFVFKAQSEHGKSFTVDKEGNVTEHADSEVDENLRIKRDDLANRQIFQSVDLDGSATLTQAYVKIMAMSDNKRRDLLTKLFKVELKASTTDQPATVTPASPLKGRPFAAVVMDKDLYLKMIQAVEELIQAGEHVYLEKLAEMLGLDIKRDKRKIDGIKTYYTAAIKLNLPVTLEAAETGHQFGYNTKTYTYKLEELKKQGAEVVFENITKKINDNPGIARKAL